MLASFFKIGGALQHSFMFSKKKKTTTKKKTIILIVHLNILISLLVQNSS